MTRSAADVLTAAIHAQVAAVVGASGAVRRDDPDAVHKQRVAVRRLRSLLRTHRGCLAEGPPGLDGLVADLAAYGRVLGDVRDAEVQRQRLGELARGLAPSASPAVRAGLVALDDAVGRRHAAARARLAAALDSPAHADLARRLRALAAAPPLTPRARRPARDVLQPRLDRAVRRARRRAGPVTAPRPGGTRPAPADVHRLRKAVRRARYTGELLASFGSGRRSRHSARTARRMKRLQDALGVVHDADTLRGCLAALRDPRTAAAVDVCTGREERRADAALARAAHLLR